MCRDTYQAVRARRLRLNFTAVRCHAQNPFNKTRRECHRCDRRTRPCSLRSRIRDLVLNAQCVIALSKLSLSCLVLKYLSSAFLARLTLDRSNLLSLDRPLITFSVACATTYSSAARAARAAAATDAHHAKAAADSVFCICSKSYRALCVADFHVIKGTDRLRFFR